MPTYTGATPAQNRLSQTLLEPMITLRLRYFARLLPCGFVRPRIWSPDMNVLCATPRDPMMSTIILVRKRAEFQAKHKGIYFSNFCWRHMSMKWSNGLATSTIKVFPFTLSIIHMSGLLHLVSVDPHTHTPTHAHTFDEDFFSPRSPPCLESWGFQFDPTFLWSSLVLLPSPIAFSHLFVAIGPFTCPLFP